MRRWTVPVGTRVVRNLDVAVTDGAEPYGVVRVIDAFGPIARDHDRVDVEASHPLPALDVVHDEFNR